MKSNLSKTIAIVVMISLIIGLSMILHVINKPADKIVQGNSAYKIDAKTLWKDYKADEEKANEKYLNKIITVNGVVSEMTEPDSLGFTVLLETGDIFNVSCEISDRSEAGKINIGEQVTIKALCAGMLMDVVLIKGQVVK